MSEKIKNANEELKKALKWLLISGAATTALNAVYTALQDFETGATDLRGFLSRLGFTIAFMVLNAVIYWLHEVSKD